MITHNYHPYPIVDIGIIVAGAAFLTPGEGAYAQRCSINGRLKNVTVADNTITARTGIVACGLLASEAPAFPWTGNRIEAVTIRGNTIEQRPLTSGDDQKTAGIITADVVEL